jgi:tetratricopeptide (TPR) repeat protein
MKITCTYHPKEEAKWFCPACRIMHCEECSSRKKAGGYSSTKDLRFCQNCGYPLENKFGLPRIEPIIKRLPQVLAYPIKPTPFILMLFLSILSFMSFMLSPYGIAAAVILWSIWLKYSISALNETLRGNMIPPDLQSEPEYGELGMLFKQILLLYPLGFIGYFIYRHSGIVQATVYFMLMGFMIPALIISLVLNNSLIKTLSLVPVVRIPLKIGMPYIFMCLFVVCLVGGISYMSMHVFQFVPENRFVFLSVMLSNYLTLVIYHMIGYLIYRHHDKLEFETAFSRKLSQQIEAVRLKPSVRALYNNVNQLIKEGRIEEAAGLLSDNIKSLHDSSEIAERLYNLQKMLRQKDELISNAPVYLNHLYINDRIDKLVDVYLECVYINRNFTPGKDVAMKIASSLVSQNKPGEAARLLERYADLNPKDDAAPKAYIQAAEIILSNTNDKKKAVDLLRTVVSTFPLHEITPYAKKKLRDLGENEPAQVTF